MINEKPARTTSGYSALIVLFLIIATSAFLLVTAGAMIKLVSILTIIASGLMALGLFMVAPNEARVLQLFGTYVGTEKTPGLRWANPFYSKKSVSLRVRNFESDQLKVNDLHGNPIDIAAVVVWKVVDSAEAVFEVDNYEEFVAIQSESALRNMATSYPYDAHEGEKVTLRADPNDVADILKHEIQERLGKAGVLVIESRISHLAYAQEIASAMLQRQQASAIIAARQKIVEGAVGMVEMALDKLSEKQVVELDEERKAAMVSNLLVVLCGDKNAQPVVNSGTLY